ncbi:MAG TPA: RHS repeat-associated core domain-containing protein, partial [Pirellulales bacterium]|nr:RHS repeat-associated core domain-containing protein [Pirellulales bacterium]
MPLSGARLSPARLSAETDYGWDNRDRLVSVKDFSGSTHALTQEVDYSYDMFNRLVGRSMGSSTERFVYDGNNATLAFNGSGAITDRFLWGPAVDQILADEQYSSPTSNPTAPGNTLWDVTDNQGSVHDLIGNLGIREHLVYDSFGAITSPSGSVTSSFLHNGTFYDPATGLELHGLRWYSPSIKRWLSPDPAGLAFDSNPYRYTGNSPTNFIDPSGLEGILSAGSIEAAARMSLPHGGAVNNGARYYGGAAVMANRAYAERHNRESMGKLGYSGPLDPNDPRIRQMEYEYYADPFISHRSTDLVDDLLQWGTRLGQAMAVIGTAGASAEALSAATAASLTTAATNAAPVVTAGVVAAAENPEVVDQVEADVTEAGSAVVDKVAEIVETGANSGGDFSRIDATSGDQILQTTLQGNNLNVDWVSNGTSGNSALSLLEQVQAVAGGPSAFASITG